MSCLPNAKLSSIPPQLRWERPLTNTPSVESVYGGLKEIGHAVLSPKSAETTAISIVTAGSFKRAFFRTRGNFNPDVFAGHFLENTDCSALSAEKAYPEKIDFLKSVNPRYPDGARIALFFRTAIEEEQQAAHNLLIEQGLSDRPFLSGTHISFGTLDKLPDKPQRQEIANYMFSLASDELMFGAVTEQHFSPTGEIVRQAPLNPIWPQEPVKPQALVAVA